MQRLLFYSTIFRSFVNNNQFRFLLEMENNVYIQTTAFEFSWFPFRFGERKMAMPPVQQAESTEFTMWYIHVSPCVCVWHWYREISYSNKECKKMLWWRVIVIWAPVSMNGFIIFSSWVTTNLFANSVASRPRWQVANLQMDQMSTVVFSTLKWYI